MPADRRTSAVELLWDLVFVFAVTQVTTLMARDLTWAGLGRALLVLALVWWAWSAFVWAANAVAEDSAVLRLALLGGMVLVLVTGHAVPHAFAGGGLIFAVSYAAVRAIHLGLYADASRRGNASWRAIAGFAVTVAIGMALLIAGALVHGGGRVALWTVAAAIDYAGPAWLTRERLRGLQRVAVAHFAERYGLFVLICLGESVVGVGVAAGEHRFDAAVAGALALGALAVAALWWTYFDRLAAAAEERLRLHGDPVLAAADAYSYLHAPLVAGIIVFAVGVRAMVADPGEALVLAERLALCGGLALYLAALTAFRLRLLGAAPFVPLLAAAALVALALVGGVLPAWAVGAVAVALLAGVCVAERSPRRYSTQPG